MNQHTPLPAPVALARVERYDEAVIRALGDLLDRVGIPVAPGDVVLVKPNMLRVDTVGATCTNAVVVAAACRYLLDRGCRVRVGDSPGFGTVAGVARAMGLAAALHAAGCGDVPIIALDAPVRVPLALGGSIVLSRHAVEADHVLNLPKLKAHAQMRLTVAVKNLYGCIPGLRKAVLHARHGDKERNGTRVFPSLVADIMGHLPPVTTVLDGITAMHVQGPSGGPDYHGALLAASLSPVALDTAVYGLLGVTPDDVPLWRELQRRNLHGAFAEQIILTGDAPGLFDFSGFVLPTVLQPESFNPLRLARSLFRRIWADLFPPVR